MSGHVHLVLHDNILQQRTSDYFFHLILPVLYVLSHPFMCGLFAIPRVEMVARESKHGCGQRQPTRPSQAHPLSLPIRPSLVAYSPHLHLTS